MSMIPYFYKFQILILELFNKSFPHIIFNKWTIPLPLHGVKEILGVFSLQYWMMANYEVFFLSHFNAITARFVIPKGAKSVIFYVFGIFADVIFQINNKK